MTRAQLAALEAELAAFDRACPKRGIADTGFAARQPARPSKGHPVILLPGSSGTAEFFHRVVAALPDYWVMPTLLDYTGAYAPRELARRLGRVIDHLGLSAPTVVGCSYSAYWIQHLPAVAPGRVGRLVLCNGFVEAADLQPNPLFDHARIRATPAVTLQREWATRAAANAGTPLGDLSLWSMTAGLSAEDLKGRLLAVSSAEPIAHPGMAPADITIVDSADDPIVDQAARSRLRARYPGTRAIGLPGGHFPYVTHPEAFAQMLLSVI